MKIYVASSWRNPFQSEVVTICRELGHVVYDFRNPAPGDNGFHWSEIDPNKDWKTWDTAEYLLALKHPVAQAGFDADFNAMKWADMMVLVSPCGRSAHLEMGWAVGAGKKTVYVLSAEDFEPELMVKMCYIVLPGIASFTDFLASQPPGT